MILVPKFKTRTVAVMGLGRSGIASAQALLASGAEVWAWDDDAASRARAEAENIPLVDLMSCDWRVPKALVLSPGIPFHYPAPHPVPALARSAGCEVLGDIELLGRAADTARLCGITGTNGKSTTTALIGHILSEAGLATATGGNLGMPALALKALGAGGTYVLELSSFQLDLTVTVAFDVAVLLNISADHLYRHGGMDGYVAAKRRIFRNQTERHAAVIGIDDEYSSRIFKELESAAGRRVIPISGAGRAPGGVYALNGVLCDDIDGAQIHVLDMAEAPRLPGQHNAQNAAAAYAASRALGLAPEAIVSGIKTFPGLAHRQELVAVVDGVRYVNDSKATNADATAKALACYGAIYWIAGGRPKEGGISTLSPWFGGIAHAFLIGEAEADFAATLEGRVPYTRCGDLARAVAQASEMARAASKMDLAASEKARAASQKTGTDRRPDPVVLLSPACASFDQWENFEARGDGFKKLVAALPGTRRSQPMPMRGAGNRVAGGRA
jgi:UDP-N-acetylmuramoylalanine--D-glutamate ligase